MNILFVCSQGINRSKTAENLVPGSKSLGIFNRYMSIRKYLLWADVIICMMEEHKHEVLKHHPFTNDIRIMGIPDVYEYNDPELIKLMKKRLKKWGFI